MKRTSLLLAILVIFIFQASSQTLNVKIIEGFKLGKIELISPFFAPEIELITPGLEGHFSRDKAAGIVGAFFNEVLPVDYQVIHHGKSPAGTVYYIGVLKTNGDNYRIYLLLAKNTETVITEMRMEIDE